MTFDIFVREYYKYAINRLKEFDTYNGIDVFDDGKELEDFNKKYSQFIVNAKFNSFLFGFTLNSGAPTEAFLELIELYSNKLTHLSIVFNDIEILKKVYDLNVLEKFIDSNIELLEEIGILK